eukprot:8697901-Pyramimonas_sp.AAC.1
MTAQRSLRARIKGWAHCLGLEVQASSTQLGVDSAGGGVVSLRARADARMGRARRRRSKLSSLGKQGARTFQVARMGFLPSVLHGAVCLGMDPTRLTRARALMASALGGNAI